MEIQKVPDIDFESWTIAEIPVLISRNEIFINEEYQRSDIWTQQQKIELIRSIDNRYSIGVLVTYLNDNKQFEILDGQQRLIAIRQYTEDNLNLTNTSIPKYSELSLHEKTLLDAYCVYYILLKSHKNQSKEEDIVQTFLRLQEGTPLNKAEELNAQRGRFKDTFRKARETHPIFGYLKQEKRFRWRQLAAELLSLELESDFGNKTFPGLDLRSMLGIVKKYEATISVSKVRTFKANLDFLHNSLNIILTAFKPGEVIAFYLLLSYLRKTKAKNDDLINEFSEYATEFLKNLHRFSIYDTKLPTGMSRKLFERYKAYKFEAKKMTTPDSIRNRFDIMLDEYQRLHPMITRDPQRLVDVEQRRTLYFRQRGLCSWCGRKMSFNLSSAHHIVAHSKGGKTGDIGNTVLLHENCHKQVEKQISRGKEPAFKFGE